jgi:hypothetical protein
LNGLDVDMLLCNREEAAKKVEETEAIVAERQMHVSIAEEACKRVSTEQKLLSDKIEVRRSYLTLPCDFQCFKHPAWQASACSFEVSRFLWFKRLS